MGFISGLVVAAVLAGPPAVPERAPPPGPVSVTVVAEVRYYTSGWGEKEMQLWTAPDPKRPAAGFILTIVEPAAHAGQVLSMHHDGVLASGDPYKVFAAGRRYEFAVSPDEIGKLSFKRCSIGWPRKELPKRAVSDAEPGRVLSSGDS